MPPPRRACPNQHSTLCCAAAATQHRRRGPAVPAAAPRALLAPLLGLILGYHHGAPPAAATFVGAFVLPHGGIALDPSGFQPPDHDPSRTAAAWALHNASAALGKTIAQFRPDVLLLITPHGISDLERYMLYYNTAASGTGETDNCPCPGCCSIANVSVSLCTETTAALLEGLLRDLGDSNGAPPPPLQQQRQPSRQVAEASAAASQRQGGAIAGGATGTVGEAGDAQWTQQPPPPPQQQQQQKQFQKPGKGGLPVSALSAFGPPGVSTEPLPLRWAEAIPLHFVLQAFRSRSGRSPTGSSGGDQQLGHGKAAVDAAMPATHQRSTAIADAANSDAAASHKSTALPPPADGNGAPPSTVAAPEPKVVILSMPSRRYSAAAAMVPELLELGRRAHAVLDVLPKRVAVIASGDLAHTWEADGPYGRSETAGPFDGAVVRWAEGLDGGALLGDAAGLVSEALSCGFPGFVMLHGLLQAAAEAAEVAAAASAADEAAGGAAVAAGLLQGPRTGRVHATRRTVLGHQWVGATGPAAGDVEADGDGIGGAPGQGDAGGEQRQGGSEAGEEAAATDTASGATGRSSRAGRGGVSGDGRGQRAAAVEPHVLACGHPSYYGMMVASFTLAGGGGG